VPVLVVRLLRNPVAIKLSTLARPVMMGRCVGVTEVDLADGLDARKGSIKRALKFWNIFGNLHCLIFPTSDLYNAPANTPQIQGINVSNACESAIYVYTLIPF
jgi:hypothetical protein